MPINKNLPYLLTAVGLFIVLKFVFTLAGNDELLFLIQPTNVVVGLLTNSTSVYLSDHGFFHEDLNIIIDKSCSGFNFWILSFLLFTYLTVKHFERPLSKSLSIPISLIVAYLFTLFVNTSRIFVSIVVQQQTKSLFNNQRIIHEGVGIITNLTFLILAYIIMNSFKNVS